ncbi:MAG: NUDIX hydrolase [Balneolaceae bacterium]
MSTIPAGGGVLFRIKNSEPEILLIKRNGVWDLPKGKKEDHETIEQCAVREVAEETGVPLPYIVSGLGKTFHEYSLNGSRFTKKTTWYSMILFDDGSPLNPQIEEDITALQWVHAEEAFEKVEYGNLKEVISRFLEKIRS